MSCSIAPICATRSLNCAHVPSAPSVKNAASTAGYFPSNRARYGEFPATAITSAR